MGRRLPKFTNKVMPKVRHRTGYRIDENQPVRNRNQFRRNGNSLSHYQKKGGVSYVECTSNNDCDHISGPHGPGVCYQGQCLGQGPGNPIKNATNMIYGNNPPRTKSGHVNKYKISQEIKKIYSDEGDTVDWKRRHKRRKKDPNRKPQRGR